METLIKFTLLLFLSALTLNSNNAEENSFPYRGTNDKPTLVRVADSSTFETQLKAALINHYGTFDANQRSDFFLADNHTSTHTPHTFSTTTLQETGVDESDRLKTDGQHLYVSAINHPAVKIFKANHRAPLIAELALETPNNLPLSGLYLHSDNQQLTALASGNGSEWFSNSTWENQTTTVFSMSVRSPAEPKLIRTLSLDGQLVSSRRIGNTLYLATRHAITLPGLVETPENNQDATHNRTLIADATVDEWLPKYHMGDDHYALFTPENCLIHDAPSANYSQHSIISLIALDLTDTSLTPQGTCFIGDTETVYASANAIYLATTQYRYTDTPDGVTYTGSPTTDIHKFSLDGLQTGYVGSANINGHLGWQQHLKSLRMSEHKGTLRVLSYVGEQAGSVASPARLHILQENRHTQSLDTIATLPNQRRPQALGKPQERIYASRFIGNRAYFVTFRTADPLYIVDLADPSDPFILSELALPGYSDYLLPVGEHFLLGIGKDTSHGAWAQGVKLSLLDISNPSAPIEKSTLLLGKRGTETAVSISPRALTTVKTGNNLRVNLPVSLHEKTLDYYGIPPHPSDLFGWSQDALYRLNIDINNGTMSMLAPLVAEANNLPENADFAIDTQWQQDRSAIIDGHDYYLKRDQIFTASH